MHRAIPENELTEKVKVNSHIDRSFEAARIDSRKSDKLYAAPSDGELCTLRVKEDVRQVLQPDRVCRNDQSHEDQRLVPKPALSSERRDARITFEPLAPLT